MLQFQPIIKRRRLRRPRRPGGGDACKTETVYNAKKKAIGVALRDGQGKLLRRFIDADGNGKMDQWGYYQDGFEVYRESDLTTTRAPTRSAG